MPILQISLSELFKPQHQKITMILYAIEIIIYIGYLFISRTSEVVIGYFIIGRNRAYDTRFSRSSRKLAEQPQEQAL